MVGVRGKKVRGNKEFIVSGKVDPKFGKILHNAFLNRTKGDYDAFISFNQQEVDIMLFEMVEFIDEIKRCLAKLL